MDFKKYWRKVRTNKHTRIVFDELPVLCSAFFFAFLVGTITYLSDGFMTALTSFWWQLAYTYVASKIVFYSAKYFALKIEHPLTSYLSAIIFPTLFSLVGTYLIQAYLVQVSMPLTTILPTLIGTPLATFGWAKVQRSLRNAPTSKT